MNKRVYRLVALGVMLLSMSASIASALTPGDVVHLKKLGFADDAIKAQIEKSGTGLRFSDAQLNELKAAGASEGLIQSLRALGVKKLSTEAIYLRFTNGKSTDELLDAMVASPTDYRLDGRVKLQELLWNHKLPPVVILGMIGRPLDVKSVKLLIDGKTSPPQYMKLLSLIGAAREELAADDALALSRQGVPDAILAAFKEGRAATIVPLVDRSGLQEYRQINRKFTFRYPQNWKMFREIKEGLVFYCFTPDIDKKTLKDVETCVSIALVAPDRDSPLVGKEPADLMKHLLPYVRANEPGMVPEGSILRTKIGQLWAASQEWKGTPKEKTGKYGGALYLTMDHGMCYQILTQAPRDEYESARDVFDRIIDLSDFGPKAGMRSAPIPPNEINARYKESVVLVVYEGEHGPESQGTGFIVHPSGYIASNAHVAVQLATGKLAKNYYAVFDSETGRKKLPLTYIGHRYQEGKNPQLYHGIDVAMFKLPPGNYKPIPLTPLGDVQLGDPIMTMGFPHADDFNFNKPSMFTTSGIVVRFNKDADDAVESIYIDAKITHGNSGGPCISRLTGGAIGLNTFLPSSKKPENHDLDGYYGVIPIEVLAAEFPLVNELGMDPALDTLDFFDAYELGQEYMRQSRWRAAVDLAKVAVKHSPKSADAQCLLGGCTLLATIPTGQESNNFKPLTSAGETALKKALELDANHRDTLLFLSMEGLYLGNLPLADEYARRAVKAHPDDFRTQLQEARVCLAAHRDNEALAAAGKANLAGHDLVADGYIIAGQLHYQQGKLEEGKAEFVRGSEIHPANLLARMGVGRFYELKKDYAAGLTEYQRLDSVFPDNPDVHLAIGRCYEGLKKYQEAKQSYDASFIASGGLGTKPLLEPLVKMAGIVASIDKDTTFALRIYILALKHHGGTPASADVHLRMARLFEDMGSPGLAFANLRYAASLQPANAEISKALVTWDLAPTSLDDIASLLKSWNLAPALVADMLTKTPLDFDINRDVAPGLRDNAAMTGITPEIDHAIRASNAAFAPPPDHAEDSKEAFKKLTGTWRAVLRCNDGTNENSTELHKRKIVMDGSKASSFYNTSSNDLTMTLDSSKLPGWIELRSTFHQPWLGIYRVNGDTLQICYGTTRRPNGFTTLEHSADNSIILMTLKREK